jgi:hypothetical protein
MVKLHRKEVDPHAIRMAVIDVESVLVEVQRKLHEIGLAAGARAINDASQAIGWEAERLITRHMEECAKHKN